MPRTKQRKNQFISFSFHSFSSRLLYKFLKAAEPMSQKQDKIHLQLLLQQMFLPFLLALFFTLSSLPPSFADATSKQYLDCAARTPFTCGNLSIDVSYPFLVDGRPDYCGYPGFNLTCVDQEPMIKMENIEYQVKGVDYSNRLLTIVNQNYVGQSCPRPDENTTFDHLLFEYSDLDLNITVLINCSSLKNPPLHDIGCLFDDITRLYWYYWLDNFSLPAGCQSTVILPMNKTVVGQLVSGGISFEGALQEGFALRWMVGSAWCGGCVGSGGICGYDSDDDRPCFCPDGLHNGSCHEEKKSKSWRKIAIGVGAGVGAIIVASLLCLAWYKHRKRKQRSTSSILLGRTASSEPCFKNDPELGKSEYQTTIFTYEELEEATNCFSASKELGDGGFGTVYKGKLRDGRVVAVKRLYEHNYRRVEQFMNEVKILSCLRHQNLVSLYGCTSRHSRELLLVYEYVSNGTVSDHLHGPRAQEGGLTWPIRLSIAIETADALGYLHAVEPQIIHRDVKTNNILLDDSFHVKVADFGLSRLFPLDATHVSTAPQGTPGYVDPEYHQCYQLTDKSDVYSFGVVLAELISSKPAVDTNRTRHEINLANMATTKIQNCQLDQLVDPSLGYQTDWEMKTMITLVAELAFRCLQLEREMRPSIKEALEVLREIESGEYKTKKVVDTDVPAKEDASLLKNILPYSPDAVTERWESRSTTPNTSG
ncbi:LEAF RUST 10 DISEASE-RESISTANCE LOCUS RECEPTOR-LIKE PROTEIN KINASE-like 1.2 isoform X1 [Phoenix dactylifera]|uniref:non-specific serine/threonine protein kinase n=1 Tax=Phoenix dactylifera TaxID=42345 RepID=A0A8B8JBU8_PHODC|nr:LEAF RUST 10 DISEASE-RESISTANCE LOCUS RECEPTOR-LIKE PROTEIN KINASE-like 1.2 isoform X1 [Phoenix dactylifera]